MKDIHPQIGGRHSDEEAIIRRIGEGRWMVQDPAGFDRRNYAMQDALLLSWGGQYESARKGLLEHVGFPGDRRVEPLINDERRERSVRSQKKDTVAETYIEDTYIGTLRPLFPEIVAFSEVRVFQGIHASLMNELDAHGQTSGEVRSMLKERLASVKLDPNVSVGANGTCFIIEGLK
jgi:hypothetical protein